GNGHGNAGLGAGLGSALAWGGEVDGVRVLSPQTIDRIFETQSDGIDLVIGIPFKFGVGYSLLPEGRVCAWGGAGGSCVIIDVDRRITFAYVMNKMAPGGGTIAAALAKRVSDIVKREAGCCARRRSAQRRADPITRGESLRKPKGSVFDSGGIPSPNEPLQPTGPTERLSWHDFFPAGPAATLGRSA